MIKSEFLVTTGMVWPVSSDKWKAPLVSCDKNHVTLKRDSRLVIILLNEDIEKCGFTN